ncbi:MAG: ATP-grasp domain-containing protein [Candidatus Moranbacteria bacterium]|nr:ATP-grasp domain-containing protein [Candidatus Moranbacteria bacterium]
MPNKKILIYFTKKEVAADPYAHIPERREIYWAIFQEGKARGFDMYLGVKPTIHHGGMEFENVLHFTGERFELKNERIRFDAIYDRSIKKYFPAPDIDAKTLNSLAFKRLANNKVKTYELLKKFMPKTFPITSKEDFDTAIALFDSKEMAVFKPVDGFGGKGVIITEAKNITRDLVLPNKNFILQKFVDTKNGVSGLTHGRHDLRIIIINGKPTMLQVRTPQLGGMLANMSQGGSCLEFPYNKTPVSIQTIVSATQKLIDATFSSPTYSIDFGVDLDGTPYIFEINDQIGLKAITGKNKELFCKNLLDSLEKKACL